LNCFPACGVIFSPSIRIAPLVNTLLLVDATVDAALSIDASSLETCGDSILSLDAIS